MIRFLLSIEGIIGIVVSIVAVIIVAFILLYIFVFSKRIRNKKIRDLELKYSYFHGVMIGECSQILKRLEIISHSNLLYSEIYSKNVKKSLEILQYNDPKASKALSDALDYILNPSKKDFKKVYEESKLVLDDYEEKVFTIFNYVCGIGDDFLPGLSGHHAGQPCGSGFCRQGNCPAGICLSDYNSHRDD